MAYIDATFLDETFGSVNVTALTPTTDERDRIILLAEAQIFSALFHAGYQAGAGPTDLTPATTPNIVQLATFGSWLELAHLRNRKELPAEASEFTGLRKKIREGDIEVSGLTKTTSRAVGGVIKTDTTTARPEGGRAPIFDSGSMDGYG